MIPWNICEKKYSGNEYYRERVTDEGTTAVSREAKILEYDAFDAATTATANSTETTAATNSTTVLSNDAAAKSIYDGYVSESEQMARVIITFFQHVNSY